MTTARDDSALHRWFSSRGFDGYGFSHRPRMWHDSVHNDPGGFLAAAVEDGILEVDGRGNYRVRHPHTWKICEVVKPINQGRRDIAIRWNCTTCPEVQWGAAVEATPPPA